jgi:hypothetical protein
VRTVLIVIFIVALIVISGPFAFALFTRRGERKPDRPGERTVATFHAGDDAVACLAEALRKRGVSVDAPGEDSTGLGMHATLGGDRAYILVGRTEEEDAPTWILRLLDPSSGGPGPSSMITPLEEALAEIAKDVRWQRR